MSVVRSMIVPIFVIVVICYCRCAEIPNQDINFDLFQNQPKSFDDQILGALKAKDGFWSGEKGKQIFQVAGAVLKVIPQLHLLGTALPLLHSLLLEDNSWIGELSKTIPLGVKLEITKDDITKIKNDINTIKEDIRQLESNALDEDVVSAKLDRIEATLYHIINGFFKGDSPYRPFPTIALPTLFALASFIANIVPLTIALSPDRAQLSRVPCLLAETITDYFQPILSERLRQVKVSAKNWRKNFPSNDVYQENSFQTPFNPNASKREQNNIRCGRIGKGENLKLTKENLILRDELNKNEDYFDDINGNCVQDYLALVRNRMETKFGEAFAAVDKFCTDEIRNRTRNPTGLGWLTIQIGAFVLSNGENCGFGILFCEPYVQISFNGEKQFKTDLKKNIKHWTTFDATYHSTKITKNTQITIKVKHHAFKGAKELLVETMDIDSLVKNTRITGKNSMLFANSLWKDELIDANI